MKQLFVAMLIFVALCFASSIVYAKDIYPFERKFFSEYEAKVPLHSSYGNTEVTLRLYCYFDLERNKHILFNYRIIDISDELAYAKILYAVGLIGSNAIRETPSVNGHDDSLIGLALKTFLPGQGCPKKPTITKMKYLSDIRIGTAKPNYKKMLRLRPLY